MANYKLGRILPDHITMPNFDGYQVRIMRGRKEHSASFAWAEHGGQAQALLAAISWRDQILGVLPIAQNGRGGFWAAASRSKKTCDRLGVTRYLRTDKRKLGKPAYLTFGVNYTSDSGTRKTKSFQVGRVEFVTPELERHAAKTADAFRSEFEFCRANGLSFDPSKYASWRDTHCYPFEPSLPKSSTHHLRARGRLKGKDQNRFISRMPDNLWRVWVTFDGVDYGQHYFGDALHSSVGAALRKAMVFRDGILRENNIPLREYKGNGWCVQHVNNKSGDVGVALTKKPADNPRFVAWMVRNMVDGQQKNQRWSIKKYGYEGAWRKAILARITHTQHPTSNEPPPPPDWLIAWAGERNIEL